MNIPELFIVSDFQRETERGGEGVREGEGEREWEREVFSEVGWWIPLPIN